jgi:hypothetical protein
LGENPHGLLALRGKILGVTLGENVEEIDHVVLFEMEVTDPGAAALTFAGESETNLSDASTPGHGSAFFGILCKFLLKAGIVVIIYQVRDEAGEGGGFDECQHWVKV